MKRTTTILLSVLVGILLPPVVALANNAQEQSLTAKINQLSTKQLQYQERVDKLDKQLLSTKTTKQRRQLRTQIFHLNKKIADIQMNVPY